MNLVVDASAILRHLLSPRASLLLADPRVELVIAEDVFGEATRGVHRRVAAMVDQGRMPRAQGDALAEAGSLLLGTVPVIEAAVYASEEPRARRRLEPHCEADDWSSVALALVMGEATQGIWTEDRDYFGCGVPVWSTTVLRRVLEAE